MSPASRLRRPTPLRDLGRLIAGADYPFAPTRPGSRWAGTRRWLVPLGLLLIVALTAAGAAYLQSQRNLSMEIATLLSASGTVPLLFVFWRPVIAWRFAYAGAFIGALWTDRETSDWPWNPVQIIVLLLVCGVVSARAAGGMVLWVALLMAIPCFVYTPNDNAFAVWMLFLVVIVLGDQVRRRTRAQQSLEAQEEITDLAKAQRAVLEERARIAREMHDVVAHHMSMIAVRAETAPYRLAELPGPARDEFAAIADAARETLADMRRLLGVLRTNREDDRQLAPQPTLADVPALITTAYEAGMPVSLEMDEIEPAPPEPVSLAAYRIVQEAVANAGRHAPGAVVRVTVSVSEDGGALRVTVANGPAPAGSASPSPGGSGHGLMGMRERAQALGGTFIAMPSRGGFEVSATFPLLDPATAPTTHP
ncbi:signal transduction histidine kinase [Catenuloplanes nepalensis]|uniref:histidine kinase n=1 Tax=Catenuloplanes nepalensis TaxID=587533 RepID=A0ABT9ML94_9ACTN|nr:histidine kinase [Catenuloplanes nepalensis]MDP9792191.1 signal transduction histidine kinase [Catenuloplanes nepalensis]